MPTCCVCNLGSRRGQKGLNCGECKSFFHPSCVAMSDGDLQVLDDLQKTWVCDSCTSRQRASRSDSTPLKPGIGKSSEEPLADLVKELLDRVKQLQEGYSDIKSSLSDIQKCITDHADALKGISASLTSLNQRLDNLSEDNIQISNRVSSLQVQLNRAEQEWLRNVVEFRGVPFVDGETLDSIVCNVGQALGVDISVSDLDYCYRLKLRGKGPDSPNPVIVRFLRHSLASKVVAARSGKRNLTTKDIGFSLSPAAPVYVNESLTPFNRKLYSVVRDLKKNGKIKYVWVRNGRIHARKEDGSERLTISSTEDTDKLSSLVD